MGNTMRRQTTKLRGWLERVRDTLLTSPAGLVSDPRLASSELCPETIIAVAGVQRISELGPRNTRFVSPVALRHIPSRMALLRETMEAGVRLLFIRVNRQDSAEPLMAALPGIVHRFDKPAMPPQQVQLFGVSVIDLLKYSLSADPDGTADALRGMETQHSNREALQLIPPEISVQRLHPVRRLLRDPRAPVYAVVGVYSALRALPVAFIREFHGSLFVFWLIDIVTAVPYTWAVLAMLFAPRRSVRALATLTALTTFAAPYVYFWLNGRDYPAYVVVVIAALTVLSVLLEIGKYQQERKLRRCYRSARVVETVRKMPVRRSHAPQANQIAEVSKSVPVQGAENG